MASQEAEVPTKAADATQTLPDRTVANPAEPEGESKNAVKKAQKALKLAEEKAKKAANKAAGKQEPKKAAPSKKKSDGPALIGIDVSGCFILKPASFFIWEEIQNFFNKKIKSIGVRNCSFPLFVSEDVLQKEKDHIEGFAAEVAWVTHAGSTPLEKKIAIRPTSETVMYPYYAKWIRSHRDLPLCLNQWNSVVRWEFKNPQPFLRTREFLWQEGHTAHLTEGEARQEVLQILDWYAAVYEELLACPVVKGQKTEKEKFAGGSYTTTVEGYIPATGRGIQGATSHGLGQNFSKMFGITVEDPSAKGDEKKPPLHVWQNSWGLSTRSLGVMVMTHSDDKGLVLPPRVAETQVIVIPVGLTAKASDEERAKIDTAVDEIIATLEGAGVRAKSDKRTGYSPGWKFNQAELGGIPLRLEVGPGELAGNFVSTARRDILGKDGKGSIPIPELATAVPALLETIQKDLYNRANAEYTAHRKVITDWESFVPHLNAKNVIVAPFCLVEECEDQIKDMSARKAEEETGQAEDAKAPSMGAKSLCIPFEQPSQLEQGAKCINPKCSRPAEKWTMFGRSY
ncbi:prolyl-tRNA synthetase [Penicillium chermesinum]|uniref:proline--tRNA ligase n=1 Tax=Penicillium chermesinum TaxID=63820 RepID=A0A9W9PIV4_9EURO|nr:prolyl-tRNA synthetase [Penicillium chermesinum]KAJ5246478.1 prolyl-tRNA synthetase [Penicillium chermesinum]